MARYGAGMTAAGAGTTVRPVLGVLATAAVTPVLREIAMWNTTAVACTYRLVTVTGGTPGATVTAVVQRLGGLATPTCLAKQLWTADATVSGDTGYRIVLGAAIGSAGILSFGGDGLTCALSAALALVPVGTGQVCEVYAIWDE